MNTPFPDQNQTDKLILVDEKDNQVGSLAKIESHIGHGKLHRAFSVFLFDSANRVMIQQRSSNKMLWGGYWANSCCSHPRLHETTQDAAHRRVKEELGVDCDDLQYLYKFVYHAKFGSIGAEYENCSVFVGYFDGNLDVDPTEISATRFLLPDELTGEIESNSDIYTPWFKLEWKRIHQDFPEYLPKASRRYTQ